MHYDVGVCMSMCFKNQPHHSKTLRHACTCLRTFLVLDLCRDTTMSEAILVLQGMGTWCTQLCCHYPMVAAAAAAVSSDQQKQHLQQLPWKKVAPLPKVAAGPAVAGGMGSRRGGTDTSSASAAAAARGATLGVTSGCRPLWWGIKDDLCDECLGACGGEGMVVCEVCSTAQYCSSRCHKAAVAAGKHPWAACRALAVVQAGKWGRL